MRLATGGALLLAVLFAIWALSKGYPLFLAVATLYIVISFAVSIFKEITRSWW
jgi:hypothetical protein